MNVEVLKDKDYQQQVPTSWRGLFVNIVDAIKRKDRKALNALKGIRPVSQSLMQEIQDNVDDYGCELAPLDDKTWEYSACQWMIEYWDVLVDLNTVEEGLSDLSLFVRVYENGNAFEFELISVHVQ